jgi:Ca-activated chloride channel family protein
MVHPHIELRTDVHPLALLRGDEETLATVRLDATAPGEVAVRPLNLALVIDKSGSMAGPKIETAKAAAASVIQKMADVDTLTVVAFDNTVEVVVPSTPLSYGRQSALDGVARIQSGGGTIIAPALRAAEQQLAPYLGGERVSAVFLVTDGQAQDPAQAQEATPGLTSRGLYLYAAGIGAGYDHIFLERLCGKNRVDDVDHPDKMHKLFDVFLQQEGRLATANCRLFVTPEPGVRVHAVITVAERGQPLQLDGQGSLPLHDLYPKKEQSVKFEFALVPNAEGRRLVARFRLRYDLPAVGVTGAEETLDVFAEVTADSFRADGPNPRVIELEGKIRDAVDGEKAEALLAKGDVRGATQKLERITQRLEQRGDTAAAAEFRARTEALQRADPNNLDLEIKRLRGTTKRLTQK